MSNNDLLCSQSNLKITGHVLIKDVDTDDILLDKFNAINYENFSIALARTLSNRPDSWIQDMVFGNGAATVSGTGTITYLPPNVVGTSAQLYNETYVKTVNDISALNLDSTQNYMTTAHISGTTYSDIIVTCTLGLEEPAGQEAFDNSTSMTSPYVFNEIGLKSYDPAGQGTGKLLTHVIFSPIAKTLSRRLSVIYTIRIQTV